MNLFRYLTGYVTVELVSADPAGALSAFAGRGIRYWNPRQTAPLTLHLCIPRHQRERFVEIVDRRGASCRILGEYGGPRLLAKLRKRKTLTVGSALLLLFFAIAPGRVWFVQVEGNETVPSQQILRAAMECGVCFGANSRQVRSERMKNEILNLVPELEWAGVNFSGGVATVSVRERKQTGPVEDHSYPTNVVASRAGVITSMSVLGGQAVCREGQAVLPGELLVTGLVDCKTHTQVTHADAEVYALTDHHLTALFPSEWNRKVYSGKETTQISILLGRKRINFFGNSGISGGSCDKMISVWTFTLPGGYSLPLQVETVRLTPFDAEPVAADEQQSLAALWQFARAYTLDNMIAGELLNESGRVSAEPGVYRLEADFACREMIARQKNLSLKESEETMNGKNR